MYQIQITVDESITAPLDTAPLEMAANAVLIQQGAPAGELTILLSTDEMLAALNQAHRGIPAPTDVLSFPAGETPALPDIGHYFGDIAVSLPRAAAQADAAGHSLTAELQLLVIHGTLHLLGHDHGQEKDKERMWSAQDAILAQLGIQVTVPD